MNRLWWFCWKCDTLAPPLCVARLSPVWRLVKRNVTALRLTESGWRYRCSHSETEAKYPRKPDVYRWKMSLSRCSLPSGRSSLRKCQRVLVMKFQWFSCDYLFGLIELVSYQMKIEEIKVNIINKQIVKSKMTYFCRPVRSVTDLSAKCRREWCRIMLKAPFLRRKWLRQGSLRASEKGAQMAPFWFDTGSLAQGGNTICIQCKVTLSAIY